MRQMTGAAFQAEVNLNEQATDPKSHTPVGGGYYLFQRWLSSAINPMIAPQVA
jgi:hypothetical protein